jgi:hypothetical protein
VGRGLEADDLHELAGSHIGRRVEAELLFGAEAGDVLIEPRPRLRRHVDPELRTDVDVAVGSGPRECGPDRQAKVAPQGTPQIDRIGEDVGPVAASNAQPPEPDDPSVSMAISQ